METVEHAAPGMGHNKGPILEIVEANPGIIYEDPEALDDLIAALKGEIDVREIDLSTTKGREAIAGMAAMISRRKVSIEEAGKARTEEWRKKTAAVNAIKKKAEEELSELRDLARSPLTKWEKEKKDRDDKIARSIERLDSASVIPAGTTSAQIESLIARLEEAKARITEEEFGEFTARAMNAWRKALDAASEALPKIRQEEADREELAKLRAEREARDRAAREAEEASRLAEQTKLTEEAAAARALEEAQREKDRLAAIEREEQIRRARDFEHRSKIKEDAVIALREVCDLPLRKAEKLFDAIAEGKIPNAYIQF